MFAIGNADIYHDHLFPRPKAATSLTKCRLCLSPHPTKHTRLITFPYSNSTNTVPTWKIVALWFQSIQAIVCSQTRYSLQLPTLGLIYHVLTHCSPSLGDCFDLRLERHRALQSTMFNPVSPAPTWSCSLTFSFCATQS
jgi:hypothetical protein